MSHPAGLPDLFLDRSLGRLQVARRLRDHGLQLIILAEHSSMPAAEHIAELAWLAEAGARGWAVLMKDERIRRNEAEEMARRFLNNLPAIAKACDESGPLLYAVHDDRIERLRL